MTPSIQNLQFSDLLEMATNNRTQPQMLSWLFEQDATASRSTSHVGLQNGEAQDVKVQGQNPER
jgi:hypothetical protein